MSSLSRREFAINVQSIVNALLTIAQPGENAVSVQISNAGGCIVRIGVVGTESMTPKELAEFLDESVEAHYAKGGV